MRNLAIISLLFLCTLSIAAPPALCAAPSQGTAVYRPLPKPGTKVPLEDGRYFTYGFQKQPKLGTCIMQVEVFGRDGKRDTSFVVKADADMPSMRGAHSSGERDFALSTKGAYLLPVQLVMPGAWEVRFTFLKMGKAVFRGSYLFDL